MENALQRKTVKLTEEQMNIIIQGMRNYHSLYVGREGEFIMRDDEKQFVFVNCNCYCMIHREWMLLGIGVDWDHLLYANEEDLQEILEEARAYL